MFQYFIHKFKLLQFRYYTGLSIDNNMEFADDLITSKNTKENNFSQVLQLFRGITKKTYVYSQSIAHMFCQFMALAYEDPTTITRQLPQYGELVYHVNSTIIIWFREYNLVVLCFAGTKAESLKDWWTNISGTYRQEWNKQRKQVIQELKKYTDAYTVVCGHSKGGILSILAYNDAGDADLSIDACYVAGVPDYFITNNNSVGIYSIKHRRDPVATILGSEMANWEILLGKNGTPSIESHRILSYINTLMS